MALKDKESQGKIPSTDMGKQLKTNGDGHRELSNKTESIQHPKEG
jgi:hypothetical protein